MSFNLNMTIKIFLYGWGMDIFQSSTFFWLMLFIPQYRDCQKISNLLVSPCCRGYKMMTQLLWLVCWNLDRYRIHHVFISFFLNLVKWYLTELTTSSLAVASASSHLVKCRLTWFVAAFFSVFALKFVFSQAVIFVCVFWSGCFSQLFSTLLLLSVFQHVFSILPPQPPLFFSFHWFNQCWRVSEIGAHG